MRYLLALFALQLSAAPITVTRTLTEVSVEGPLGLEVYDIWPDDSGRYWQRQDGATFINDRWQVAFEDQFDGEETHSVWIINYGRGAGTYTDPESIIRVQAEHRAGGAMRPVSFPDGWEFFFMGTYIESFDHNGTVNGYLLWLDGVNWADPEGQETLREFREPFSIDAGGNPYYRDVPVSHHPEPGTWLTLACGLGVIGWLQRLRRSPSLHLRRRANSPAPFLS